MSALKELQTAFQNYLIKDEEGLEKLISDPPKGQKEDRLDVYHYAYRQRLIDIIAMDYPVLKKYLGENKFEETCHQFIQSNPSKDYSVNYYGRDLPNFLSDEIQKEIATFEWALTEVMDRADASVASLEKLNEISEEAWGRLQVSFHPSLSVLKLKVSVPKYWHAVIENESLPECKTSDETLTWLVWRKRQDAYYQSLDSEETIMFNVLREGASFGEVCKQLCQTMLEDDVAQFALDRLVRFINDQLITDINA